INTLVLIRFEFARCRMSRCGFEAFVRTNSQSLKIKIKQRVLAVPYRRVLDRRDDAPLPFRLDKVREFERKIDKPKAGRVFDISPIRRSSSAMLTPPVTRFELERRLAGRESLPPSAPGKSIEVAHQQRLHLGVLDMAFYFWPIAFQIVVLQIIYSLAVRHGEYVRITLHRSPAPLPPALESFA